MQAVKDQKLRLLGDYHTHTVYSKGIFYRHGKGTVLENAKEAFKKGLKEIAITDHGPAHRLYGINIAEIPQCRDDIEKAKKLIPDITIYLSVEANIVDTSSGLDIEEADRELFDYLTAGYHYGSKNSRTIRNIVSYSGCMPIGSRERLRSWNTDKVIRAIYQNDIKVLTHPCDKAFFDEEEIFKACEARNTIIEINNRHDNLSIQDIYEIAKFDLKFIVNSDAHKPKEVGRCEKGIAKVLDSGLDISRVVNLERRS